MTESLRHTQADDAELAEMLRVALSDHRGGRGAKASQRYRSLLSIEPRVADAWHLLGLLAHADRRAGEADQQIRRALALNAAAALYWLNLGNVLSDSGRIEDAAACFEQALDQASEHEGTARHLGNARIRLALTPEAVDRCRRRWGTADADKYHAADTRRRVTSGPGHLLIRGWGFGFWGEVNHVIVQLALAEIMGREPTVYWGSELRYRLPGLENAWDAYFEPVSAIDISAIENAAPTCFPGQWTIDNLRTSRVLSLRESVRTNPHGLTALAGLNRPEGLVVADGYNEMSDVLAWAAPRHPLHGVLSGAAYRRLFSTYLHLRPDIKHSIAETAARLFANRPVMGLHCRAQQPHKAAESLERQSLTIEPYFDQADRFVASYPGGRLFLLCDLVPTVDAFRARYGDRLIVLPRQRMAEASQQDVGFDQARSGHRLALEVVEDAYLAAECDFFLGDGASGVSCSVAVLKDWPEGRIRLLRRNVFQERRGGDYMGRS